MERLGGSSGVVDQIPRLIPRRPCTLIRAGRRELTFFGQLGTSFGLAITTIVYDNTLERESRALGVDVNGHGAEPPKSAELQAYHDANWGAFAFGILGKLTFLFPSWDSTLFCPFCCGGPSNTPFVQNGESSRSPR